MSLWLLVPRDPLIFRDGKPFSAIPGERSKSIPFPYPVTLAGAARTRQGIDQTSGEFDKSRVKELKKVKVRGPVLVELDHHGHVDSWFFPAPADALLVMKNGTPTRYSLAPLAMPAGAFCDLDAKNLVGPAVNVKDKPLSDPPRYWNWEQIKAWLEKTTDGKISPDELGIQGPVRETRTHVSILADTQAALSGALFQTSGLEFVRIKQNGNELTKLDTVRSLALALETDADFAEGLGFVGGEHRVTHWEKAQGNPLPKLPDSVKQKIIEQGHCRLILATPAYFEQGYLPSDLGVPNHVTVTVQATALPRYQTVSGWDYELGKPKPTCRLVPAGSVYFLKLEGDKDAIANFLDMLWLRPVSDESQFRTDGFGLALFGTWGGNLRTMEMEVKP